MDRWLQQFARTNLVRSSDTAHDLKTPLNVAVLNLELLKMRARKLMEQDDPKLMAYAASIEVELRRMARIFDSFFLLSTPPKGEGAPSSVELPPLAAAAAEEAGYTLETDGQSFRTIGHEARIRQAFKLFLEGAASVLAPEGRAVHIARQEGRFHLIASGRPRAEDFEPTKIFKFYYTDPSGNPDLSLATARLIAETYGGELIATQESDKVSLRIGFPPGEE
ncbi:MAG TPA: histidine kinase dimerization/phospho-acceptor domain-containing protein [Thermoanaerobaculia bacterium]|jgi:nitrogen fixation/metabolism regulation signal transduction histidine kinase|nr:histidine kinase dimerization/phospho-acceptor domain-containing protein [Thermoanaerobaculia bacterium]